MNRMIFTGLNVLVWCFCLDAMVINGKEMNRVVTRDSVSGERKDSSTIINADEARDSTPGTITTPVIEDDGESITATPDALVAPSIIDEGDTLRTGTDSVSMNIGKSDVFNKSNSPNPLIRKDPLPGLIWAQNLAVAGTILFGSSILLEQFVLNPWSNRVMDKYSAAKTETETTQVMDDVLAVLVAGVPVGLMKIAGPTLACFGASRSYGTYYGIDKTISDIRVWRPYVVGWVLGAAGTAFGFLGGFTGSKELAVAGSVLGLGRDVTWSVATIWSLAYTVTTKNTVLDKGHVYLIPCSENGYGFTLRMEY